MNVFDTDILTDILNGVPAVVARGTTVPRDKQAIAIVSVEEVIRGQFNAIRQADAGRGRLTTPQAYELFFGSFRACASFRVFPYTQAAHAVFLAWRAAKIRIGTQDLRIAAIATAHNATLVTRNARDYRQVPGLMLEIWN